MFPEKKYTMVAFSSFLPVTSDDYRCEFSVMVTGKTFSYSLSGKTIFEEACSKQQSPFKPPRYRIKH